jgi:P27 family predicted phage terminase small subunit
MALTGRKPKPTAVLKLEGTFLTTRHGGRSAVENLAQGELADSAPPEWMTETQKAHWHRIIANVPYGILRNLDMETFANYIVTWDRFQRACEAQNRLDEGKIYPFVRRGPNGSPVESAFIGIMNRASLLLIRYAAEMGFTPSARARLASDGFEPAKPEQPVNSWSRIGTFGVISGSKRS